MSSKVSTLQRILTRGALPLAAASLFLLAEGCTNQQDQQEQPAAQASLSAELLSNPQMALKVQSGSAHLLSLRSQLGLNADHNFQARSANVDILHRTHIRYDQTFRGVRVWEGDAVVQMGEDGQPQLTVHGLKANINIATAPTLTSADAQGIAHAELRPVGEYASSPTAELVIFPRIVEREKAQRLRGAGGELNAEDMEEVVQGYSLAYHVHTSLQNGALETKHTDFLIDAHTGDVLKKWNSLQTTAATGTGNSQYSGTVSLGTNTSGSGWELHDVARGMNITTYNLNGGTSGTGTVFTDTDDTWGDGKNYKSGSGTDNQQTAGVDAHYGTEETYDYYKNVHNRNGIDGAGKATYNRVHYSKSYDNAFWDDTCFCMTYGDGSEFTVLTSIDVAGHEMTHGVTSRTAALTYSGEPGGLNESMSDINGTMVEFYSYNHLHGGAANTIGDTGGTWTIGEQLNPTPLRYMYKPSKDGASPDAWSTSVSGLDVHYSSGPMNRAFYFLSQGSSPTSTSDYYSKYLPAGMTGIGNDKAAKIVFLALTAKMKSSTKYADARTAYLSAATDLFGATSAEYAAVENAFGGINVGAIHSGGGDTVPPTTSITAPKAGATITGTSTITADASDNVAVTKVEFYVGATLVNTDTTSPYSYAWNSASVANGSYAITSKAYDAAGNVGTSTAVSVTVSNMVSDTTPPTTTLTAPKAGATLTGTATLTADATDNVAVTKVEFYYGTTLIGSTAASPYSFSWNTTGVANGSYSLTSKAYDAAGNVGTSTAVSVTVSNMTSDTVPPSTSLTAPTSGATVSGNVTVSATATDNIGVTKVEFYAGATLLGTDTASPYSVVWDSTKVANGSYAITSKAYDAAGNVGTSPASTVTVKNGGGTCGTTSQLLKNNDFESGDDGSWTATSGVIDDSNPANAHGGDFIAWFGGFGSAHTDTAYQTVSIPAAACSASFSFWLAVQTDEIGTKKYDKLTVTVQDTSGKVLGTLATYSNVDDGDYSQKTFDLSAYKGKTVRINFKGTEDAYLTTNFFVDDTALTITQ